MSHRHEIYSPLMRMHPVAAGVDPFSKSKEQSTMGGNREGFALRADVASVVINRVSSL